MTSSMKQAAAPPIRLSQPANDTDVGSPVALSKLSTDESLSAVKRVLKRLGRSQVSDVSYPQARLKNVQHEDREFLSPVLALIETPASPRHAAMLITICAATASLILWSFFSQLEIFATASGKVQPSGLSKIIQPLEPGRVVNVLVKNGTHVESGDVLIEMDATEPQAERKATSRELQAVEAEILRRTLIISSTKDPNRKHLKIEFPATVDQDIRDREGQLLHAEMDQLQSSLDTIEAQTKQKRAEQNRIETTIDARKQLMLILQERVDNRNHLDKLGQGYRGRVIDALQELERERTNLASDEGQLLEVAASLKMLDQKSVETKSLFIADQSRLLLDAERKRNRLVEELVKATSREERTVLRAPIAGVVQQLKVNTVGQVVSSGETLMTIVPRSGPMEVEALIKNADIGFVEVGQPVVVKVEAFPFTRYGTIPARVTRVSKEAVDTASASHDPLSQKLEQGTALVFPVTIELDQQSLLVDGRTIELQPGMSVTAEIRTGERRVIDYVFAPLSELAASSGRER